MLNIKHLIPELPVVIWLLHFQPPLAQLFHFYTGVMPSAVATYAQNPVEPEVLSQAIWQMYSGCSFTSLALIDQ